jgi:hypothetical protein
MIRRMEPAHQLRSRIQPRPPQIRTQRISMSHHIRVFEILSIFIRHPLIIREHITYLAFFPLIALSYPQSCCMPMISQDANHFPLHVCQQPFAVQPFESATTHKSEEQTLRYVLICSFVVTIQEPAQAGAEFWC